MTESAVRELSIGCYLIPGTKDLLGKGRVEVSYHNLTPEASWRLQKLLSMWNTYIVSSKIDGNTDILESGKYELLHDDKDPDLFKLKQFDVIRIQIPAEEIEYDKSDDPFTLNAKYEKAHKIPIYERSMDFLPMDEAKEEEANAGATESFSDKICCFCQSHHHHENKCHKKVHQNNKKFGDGLHNSHNASSNTGHKQERQSHRGDLSDGKNISQRSNIRLSGDQNNGVRGKKSKQRLDYSKKPKPGIVSHEEMVANFLPNKNPKTINSKLQEEYQSTSKGKGLKRRKDETVVERAHRIEIADYDSSDLEEGEFRVPVTRRKKETDAGPAEAQEDMAEKLCGESTEYGSEQRGDEEFEEGEIFEVVERDSENEAMIMDGNRWSIASFEITRGRSLLPPPPLPPPVVHGFDKEWQIPSSNQGFLLGHQDSFSLRQMHHHPILLNSIQQQQQQGIPSMMPVNATHNLMHLAQHFPPQMPQMVINQESHNLNHLPPPLPPLLPPPPPLHHLPLLMHPHNHHIPQNHLVAHFAYPPQPPPLPSCHLPVAFGDGLVLHQQNQNSGFPFYPPVPLGTNMVNGDIQAITYNLSAGNKNFLIPLPPPPPPLPPAATAVQMMVEVPPPPPPLPPHLQLIKIEAATTANFHNTGGSGDGSLTSVITPPPPPPSSKPVYSSKIQVSFAEDHKESLPLCSCSPGISAIENDNGKLGDNQKMDISVLLPPNSNAAATKQGVNLFGSSIS